MYVERQRLVARVLKFSRRMNGYGSACIDILISNLSFDQRDSRANFATFQFSLLVVNTFVVIVKIKGGMILADSG